MTRILTVPGVSGVGLAIMGAALPALVPKLPLMVAAAMFVIGIGLIGSAFVRHVVDVRRAARGAPRAGVTAIGLDDGVRYIARESQFGRTRNADDPNFAIWIGDTLQSALVTGDIAARGRWFHVLRGGICNPPLHPRLPIAKEFWARHRINAWWALNDQGQNVNGRLVGDVMVPNMRLHPSNECYQGMHDILLDRDRLFLIWPKP